MASCSISDQDDLLCAVLKAGEERPTNTQQEESLSDLADAAKQATEGQQKRRRTSDSSDFITSALTRRFGCDTFVDELMNILCSDPSVLFMFL